jgi:hypothetical protein
MAARAVATTAATRYELALGAFGLPEVGAAAAMGEAEGAGGGLTATVPEGLGDMLGGAAAVVGKGCSVSVGVGIGVAVSVGVTVRAGVAAGAGFGFGVGARGVGVDAGGGVAGGGVAGGGVAGGGGWGVGVAAAAPYA